MRSYYLPEFSGWKALFIQRAKTGYAQVFSRDTIQNVLTITCAKRATRQAQGNVHAVQVVLANYNGLRDNSNPILPTMPIAMRSVGPAAEIASLAAASPAADHPL